MIWKTIQNNSNYEVSTTGLIKNKKTGKILKPWTHLGYQWIRLGKNGKNKSVHRIVALTFLPKIEGKDFVNHKDSNRSNNNVENLEWCTKSENSIHGIKYGNLKQGFKKKHKDSVGSKNTMSKLTESDIKKIRSLREKGLTLQKISDIFNVSLATIGYIIQGKTWKHV